MVEQLICNQQVVGSTPTLPIVYFGDKMIAGFVIGIFAGYLFAYIQVSLDNERKDD